MKRREHRYEGETLTVTYDSGRCIHAAECVRGAPAAFDPERRPWVDPGGASVERLLEVIESCPTGALGYERADGETEKPPPAARVRVGADGPLYLVGDIEIRDAGGEVVHRDTRVALCRCGASEIKPFCDGSHADAGFSDAGAVSLESVEGASEPAAKLVVKMAANGPLVVSGDFAVEGAGGERARRRSAALCRCGASATKPLCDGSHVAIGFEHE